MNSMIYTKDNIVGVEFADGVGITYKVISIAPDRQVSVELSHDGETKVYTYSLSYVLGYLSNGGWKPVNDTPSTTPRQQADDLLSEFIRWHTKEYRSAEDVSLHDIQDFLNQKFGKQ